MAGPSRRLTGVNPFAASAAAASGDSDKRAKLVRNLILAIGAFLLLVCLLAQKGGQRKVPSRLPAQNGTRASLPDPPLPRGNAPVATVRLGSDGILGARWRGSTTELVGVREGSALHRAGGAAYVGRVVTHVNGVRVFARVDITSRVMPNRMMSLRFAPAAATPAPDAVAPRRRRRDDGGDGDGDDKVPSVSFMDTDDERATFSSAGGVLWFSRSGPPEVRMKVPKLYWAASTRELTAAGWRMRPKDEGRALRRLLRRLASLAAVTSTPHNIELPAPAPETPAPATDSPERSGEPACPRCVCPTSGKGCRSLKAALEDQRLLAAQRARELSHCQALVEERATPAPSVAAAEESADQLVLPADASRVSVHIGGAPTTPNRGAHVILVSPSQPPPSERTVWIQGAVGAAAGVLMAQGGAVAVLPLSALLSSVPSGVSVEHLAFEAASASESRRHAASMSPPAAAASLRRVALITLELPDGSPPEGLPQLTDVGFAAPQVCWRGGARRCLPLSAASSCSDCAGAADVTWQRG